MQLRAALCWFLFFLAETCQSMLASLVDTVQRAATFHVLECIRYQEYALHNLCNKLLYSN